MRINYPHFTHGERQTQVNFPITTGLELFLAHSLLLLLLNCSFLTEGCVQTYVPALLEESRIIVFFFLPQKNLVCQLISAKAVVKWSDATTCKFLQCLLAPFQSRNNFFLFRLYFLRIIYLYFLQQWPKTINHWKIFILSWSEFRVCVLCFCPTQIKWVRLELWHCWRVYSTDALCCFRSELKCLCTHMQKPLLHLGMMHNSGPHPLNSSRNGSYLLSCFTGGLQKIMDRLLMKTRGVGRGMSLAFAYGVFYFLAEVNPPFFPSPSDVSRVTTCCLW